MRMHGVPFHGEMTGGGIMGNGDYKKLSSTRAELVRQLKNGGPTIAARAKRELTDEELKNKTTAGRQLSDQEVTEKTLLITKCYTQHEKHAMRREIDEIDEQRKLLKQDD